MWIGRFWEYLVAAGLYWWAALAVFLAIERLAERGFHDFWRRRIDPWFTPQRRKQALLVFALAAFVIGNFRAWNEERDARIVAKQMSTSRNRDEQTLLAIKDILAKTIADGEKLLIDWQKADVTQFENNVMARGTKADNFVLAAFGSGEQALFESNAGYVFYGDGSRASVIHNSVDGRLRRLNDLVQRSGAVPVQRDFDPSKFR
jgi:hypothetical protein